MAYFLFKTEPDEFSLQDLADQSPVPWDGVRNYGARNRLKTCETGDLVFVYHSGKTPAIVGLGKVVSEPYADATQYDPASDYFDAKATADTPRWWSVDLHFEERFVSPLTLKAMKAAPALSDMEILRQSRLSVSSVSEEDALWILTYVRGQNT